MKKKMIRKYSKMLNILYKCKVVSMRNKGWGRILRSPIILSKVKSFKSRQKEEGGAKKTTWSHH